MEKRKSEIKIGFKLIDRRHISRENIPCLCPFTSAKVFGLQVKRFHFVNHVLILGKKIMSVSCIHHVLINRWATLQFF